MAIHAPTAAVSETENPEYLTKQLITYLGNKRLLLPFIGDAVRFARERLGGGRLRMADMFSGTGVVSRYFKRFASEIHANDLEVYAETVSKCFLANASGVDWRHLAEAKTWLDREMAREWKPGLICENYAPRDESAITPEDRVFYTRRNAIFLDTARRAIRPLPGDIQSLFLGPLLSEASVHANTPGVFKGFYRNAAGIGQFGGDGRNALKRIAGDITLNLPVLSRFECDVFVHRKDANELAGKLPELDFAYFDPPYNQHPYGSNYFMLNLLAEYAAPAATSRASGIPVDWNRSRYNRRAEAEEVLFAAIAACPAKFVLVSGNSDGFVPARRLAARLSSLGSVSRREIPHPVFRGCRNLAKRGITVAEYLILLEKK